MSYCAWVPTEFGGALHWDEDARFLWIRPSVVVTLYVSLLHVPFDALSGLVDGSLELTDNLPGGTEGAARAWSLLRDAVDVGCVFNQGISNIPRLSRNRDCAVAHGDAGVQRSTAAKGLLNSD